MFVCRCKFWARGCDDVEERDDRGEEMTEEPVDVRRDWRWEVCELRVDEVEETRVAGRGDIKGAEVKGDP